MKKITLENNNYTLEENYKDGFDLEELNKRFTDFFSPYDYVLGDWSYGSLRLKGFYTKSKKKTKINDYKNIKSYISDYCAPDCSYFIIKKVE